MKKFFYMAVAAIAALSSCSSDNDAILGEGGNGNNNGESKVFTGIIESDATTRTTIADGSDTKKKVQWESSDEISINGIKFTTTPDGTDATKATFAKKTASDADPTGTYKACYPACMASGTGSSVTFSLPATYTYETGKFNMPMYAENSTTSLSFQNICGVLAIKVTSEEMTQVTKITVTSDKAISGPCTIAATEGKYAATAKGTADANKTVTLDCGTGGVTPSAEGTIFYLPVPAISDAKLYISVLGSLSTTKATEYKNLIYRQAMNTSNVSVARNTIYNVNFKTSLAKFTVKAAEGENPAKTVNFTKGNLYYNSTDSKYYLESAQNVTYATLGQSAYDATHVCHFYWANTTDSQTSGKEPWAEIYSSSLQNTGDKFFCGEDNKMTVDGTPDLYALSGGSGGEWKYLINSRDNASNLYKYGVSVTTSAGTVANCLIIAPDGYDYTAHPLQTSYDATAWSAAEALGLVCLPAAGYRNGSNIDNGGYVGYYWSSSPYAANAYYAYYLSFRSDNVDPANGSNRNSGYSLRLVK